MIFLSFKHILYIWRFTSSKFQVLNYCFISKYVSIYNFSTQLQYLSNSRFYPLISGAIVYLWQYHFKHSKVEASSVEIKNFWLI